MEIPMDPESNWDICPVCHHQLSNLAEFPGIEKMRAYHEEHKRFKVPEPGPYTSEDFGTSTESVRRAREDLLHRLEESTAHPERLKRRKLTEREQPE